jgi:hypothetical protein
MWLDCEKFLGKLAAIKRTLVELRPVISDLLAYEQALTKYLEKLKHGLDKLHYLETSCVKTETGISWSDFWPPWPLGSAAASGAARSVALPAPAAACCGGAESEGPDCRGTCPPPPPPAEKKIDSDPIDKPVSADPNDKIGPAAFGAAGFLQPGVLPYEIEFENDPNVGATVPAQEVFVTDTLDADLDLSTLEFTRFGFNNLQFAVPAGLSHYQTTLDLRPNGINLLVEVVLSVDLNTRVLSASFRSLDPLTHQLPEAVDAGFLPVNDKALHNGEGFFLYTVRPKAGLPSGTVITNQASIVFDVNAPILTPLTTHTLDVAPPTSQVAALPANSGPSIAVQWSGADDAGGAGIAYYDVYVATDNGPVQAWQTATMETSATFTGAAGHSYSFYSLATDNVGRQQAAPLASATTTVVDNIWHNAQRPCDVTGDDEVQPLDVLTIINHINSHPASTDLPAAPAVPPPYLDVTNDREITPLDVLTVINYINSPPGGAAAGEAVPSPDMAAEVAPAVASVGTESRVALPDFAAAAPGSDVLRAFDRLGGAEEAGARTPRRQELVVPSPQPDGAAAVTAAARRTRPAVEIALEPLEEILHDLASDIDRVWRGWTLPLNR